MSPRTRSRLCERREDLFCLRSAIVIPSEAEGPAFRRYVAAGFSLAALRLGHFFGTSPQFWLNLQTLYDVRIAEQKAGKTIRSLPRLKRKELLHA